MRAFACAAIVGSIPAWAGETPSIATPSGAVMVYPRVGGGNPFSCVAE